MEAGGWAPQAPWSSLSWPSPSAGSLAPPWPCLQHRGLRDLAGEDSNKVDISTSVLPVLTVTNSLPYPPPILQQSHTLFSLLSWCSSRSSAFCPWHDLQVSALGELWLSCHYPYTPKKVNTERQWLRWLINHPLLLCSCISFDKCLARYELVATNPLATLCLSCLVEMHPLTPMHQPGFVKPLFLQMAGVDLQGHRVLSHLMCPMTSPDASLPGPIQKARGLPADHCSHILRSSHAVMLPNWPTFPVHPRKANPV